MPWHGGVLLGVICFGSVLGSLGLGEHILDSESILGVLGLGQRSDLLTLIHRLRTLLDGLFTLGHLSPLALVTNLASSF